MRSGFLQVGRGREKVSIYSVAIPSKWGLVSYKITKFKNIMGENLGRNPF